MPDEPNEDLQVPHDLPASPHETYNPEITAVYAKPDRKREAREPDRLESLPRWVLLSKDSEDEAPASEAQIRPRFRLERRAGFGGYGEVWEARQLSLDRVVAIKVIREDLPGSSDSARQLQDYFRHEAVTTARLEHPNIVPIYDLGADESGRPLLAMRYAKGRSWSLMLVVDRAEMQPRAYYAKHVPILIAVSQAVAYAHSRGVIHRDLKPSQVIVGDYGEVLLTDWGLALDREHDHLLRDESGEGPAGTVAFMAPEQTRANVSLIGPSTDVYLLGGTLYFMLTGEAPHEASEAIAALRLASEGIVRDPYAVAPDRELPPELVSIALAALEKLPKSRIQTAEEFVRRLQDYLSGTSRREESEALVANVRERLPRLGIDYAAYSSLLNKLSKAAQLWSENPAIEPLRDQVNEAFGREAVRNGDLVLAQIQALQIRDEENRRVLLAEAEAGRRRKDGIDRQRKFAFAAAAILAVILVLSGVFYARNLARERSAQEAARRDAEDLMTFMLSDLGRDLEPIGKLGLLEDVSKKALAHFASMPSSVVNDETRAGHARALDLAGDVFLARGNTGKAEEALNQAYEIRVVLTAKEPSNLEWKADLAKSYLARARLETIRGNAAAAFTDFEKARELLAFVTAKAPANQYWKRQTASLFSSWGELLTNEGRIPEASEKLGVSQKLYAELVKEHPEDLNNRRDLGVAHSKLGDALDASGDAKGALAEYEAYLGIMNELVSRDPNTLQWSRELAVAHNSVGWALRALGRTEEALAQFEMQRSIMREVVSKEPTSSEWSRELAFSEAVIGRMRLAKKDASGALGNLSSSTSILRDWAGRDPSNSVWARDAAVSGMLLAQALEADGKSEAAIRELENSTGVLQGLVAKDKANTGWVRDLAQARRLLGSALIKSGDAAAGRIQLGAAITLMEPITTDLATSPPPFLDTRASALILLGRKDDAKPIVEALARKGYNDPDLLALVSAAGMKYE